MKLAFLSLITLIACDDALWPAPAEAPEGELSITVTPDQAMPGDALALEITSGEVEGALEWKVWIGTMTRENQVATGEGAVGTVLLDEEIAFGVTHHVIVELLLDGASMESRAVDSAQVGVCYQLEAAVTEPDPDVEWSLGVARELSCSSCHDSVADIQDDEGWTHWDLACPQRWTNSLSDVALYSLSQDGLGSDLAENPALIAFFQREMDRRMPQVDINFDTPHASNSRCPYLR